MQSKITKYHIENSSNDGRMIFYFGLATFLYALCAGVFIQIYAVPVLFPHFNLGDGLVVLDSIGFDSVAREKAFELTEKGIQVWELRPKGQMPSGIASFFYFIWTPKPYALLPFNALVHALSGCIVVWLLRHFFSWKPVIIGSALFVLNPAAMEWVAQIHRDGVFILGNLMVLVSLFQFSKSFNSDRLDSNLNGVLWGITGTSVIWVARPFWIQVIFVSILLWIFAWILLSLFSSKNSNEN